MFSVLHPVNPTSRLCVYLEQDAIPQGKSVFSLVASCQPDHRASTALGRGDKGGSEVQIAGFQHCELMSNMPFLGEGLMQVTTKEGEGIESKDRAETRDWEGEDKLRSVLVVVFLQGTVEELPLPVQPVPTIAGKSLSQWSQHPHSSIFLSAWICILDKPQDSMDLLCRFPRPALLQHTPPPTG